MGMLLKILTLLGSLGMFLYGMSLMSGGLQKMAGAKLRGVMSKATSSRFKCIISGIVITALVQSSTATTLMLVSFVNAGLLSLVNAIGVIMGANIGTTVTAWIFALSFGNFNFSLGTIAVPLMFFAFLAISLKNRKYNNLGEFLMGFALLFLGLTTLRETSTVLLDNDTVRVFLSGLTGAGIFSILLFMAIGAMMTLMLQSSAATMAITMVLVANGYIPFTIAAAMVLGENIGTTITSNIAASVANVSAKRTARAHMLFNVFGVIWAGLLFRPFLSMIGKVVEGLFGFPNPMEVAFDTADEATREQLVGSLPFVVATLHTFFNVITTMILVWFIPVIEKIVTKMVPNPKGEEVYHLKFIHGGVLNTAELSLKESQQEIVRFGELCRSGLVHVREAVACSNEEEFDKCRENLIKFEEQTDSIEFEIASYLGEVSKMEVSSSALSRIKGSYRIIGEMESLGDSEEAIGRMLQRCYDHRRKFSQDMLGKVGKMLDLLDEAYAAMVHNLRIPVHEISDIENAILAESRINNFRDKLRDEHLNNFEREDYDYETGVFYMDIISEMEKMGDFVINISEALMDEKED